MKLLIILLCAIVVLVSASMLLFTAHEEAKATRKMESLCISKYIQLGIERRDIVVSNGTCFLRTN